ncbi:MAG: hypothetical protein SFZ23_02540 [Planctomycetota bacterium]|nr:hypothetical protein [Planctomycetota bacterium]
MESFRLFVSSLGLLAVASGTAQAQLFHKVVGSTVEERAEDLILNNQTLVGVGESEAFRPEFDRQAIFFQTLTDGTPLSRTLLGEPLRAERGFSIERYPTGELAWALHSSENQFPPDSFELALVRSDALGNVQWTRRYVGTSANFLEGNRGGAIKVVDNDIFVAHRLHTDFESRRAMFSRIDAAGNPSFQIAYDILSPTADKGLSFNDLAFDRASQTFIVVGTIRAEPNPLKRTPSNDIFVARLREDGSVVWAHRFDVLEEGSEQGNEDEGRGVAIRPDGNIVVASFATNEFFNSSTTHLLLDPAGNLLLSSGLVPPGPAFAACEALPDGTVVIAGQYSFGDGGSSTILWRLDANLNLVFFNQYVAGGFTAGEAVAVLPGAQPEFVVTGAANLFGSGFGQTEVHLVGTDSAGNTTCNFEPLGFIEPRVIVQREVVLIPSPQFGLVEWQPEVLRAELLALEVCQPNCAADFNGDGVVDFFDYLDFALAYSIDDPSADFNNDGVVDFFDYLDFALAYDVGC